MAELSKLGRYELRRILGRGAMGVVYEGFDPTLGRRVAVKTILKGATLDEEMERAYSARFVKEAKAVGRLNHPNIVQVFDFGEENEIAYLVMEFIQGRELRSYFAARERFEPPECVRIMGELLDALEFAHEAGVVHRDVKPANVMLDAQRRVKLADFGVARVLDGAEQSMAGTMVGTPAFMSPEQISGGKIDRRTDVFSAGTILYQLLTGEQPFKGDGAWTVAKQIMQDDPARPSSIVTNLPLAFDEVVHRSLAKSPAQRYPSAREFAGALRGVLGGTPPAATSPGTVMPKPKSAAAAQTSDAEVEFWRSIQNSNDVEEFSTYLEAFPDGTYSQLARVKMAKLKGSPAADSQATVRLEAESKARQEAEAKARREAEEQAQRVALAKAKREAEEKAKREALEKARREAEDKAKREAEERTRRVAEEKARRDTEEKAKREAAEKARREAEEKAKREAAEKAKREAEEKIRQAQALARLKQQEEAAARARSAADEDATVSIGSAKPAPGQPLAEQKKPYLLPAAAAAVLVVAGIGAYLFLGRTPVPVPATPSKTEVSAADIEKIRKDVEERIRREYADKSAAEQAAAAKAAGDKAVQEKQLAMKAAAEKASAEKAAREKVAADKAAAEKTMATRMAAERSAADRAAAEKAMSEKATAERAATEKAAVERAAAEKAAAEKAAAAKPPVAPWIDSETGTIQRTAKAAAAKTQTALAVPASPGASASGADALFQQAAALEGERKVVDAVRLYIQAARAGSGQAAKKLGDIYHSGAPGVSPDSAESVKWYNLARARGIQK